MAVQTPNTSDHRSMWTDVADIALCAGWWLTTRLIITAALATVIATTARYGIVGLVVSGTVVVLTWWHFRPANMVRHLTARVRAQWRLWFVYGTARWRAAMAANGLALRYEGELHVPPIDQLRSTRWVDALDVQMLTGQVPDDWTDAAEALAHAFAALACRVTNREPGWVRLEFQRHDPLRQVVPALEPSDDVDLTAIPVGRREDGRLFRLPIIGRHLLIAGATGAGKGSVIWSLIRGVAPAVHAGLVRLWTCDPKGGMELAFGRPLFDRFAYTAEHIVTLLEDAVVLLQDRAERLRGVTRLHTPTRDEPLVVVILDEAAFITAYLSDGPLSKRAAKALAVILSQGRAVGVVCVAALQDPRQEVIPVRNLFPLRIALALEEPKHVDLVLGDGAHARGARCEDIPDDLPGVAYVKDDGQRHMLRVRFSWMSDDDIADTVARWAAPAYPDAIDTTATEPSTEAVPA